MSVRGCGGTPERGGGAASFNLIGGPIVAAGRLPLEDLTSAELPGVPSSGAWERLDGGAAGVAGLCPGAAGGADCSGGSFGLTGDFLPNVLQLASARQQAAMQT